MARYDDRLDSLIATLKLVDDEDLTSLSHNPAAQALCEEVTSMTGSKEKRGTRRRRLLWQGALVAGAAVVVLAVLSIVNVFGANGPSIVENAVAALAFGDDAIVHVKIVGNESGKDGYTSTWTEESWSSTAPPHSRRTVESFSGSPTLETTMDDTGFTQVYDAATNTIFQPPQSGVLAPDNGDQADQYREMILSLLQSGDAAADGHESVDGRDVIRILATKDYGTAPDGKKYETVYLIDAKTNDPVAWRMTREGGKVVDLRFAVYEELSPTAENLALLHLAKQYPGATINTSLEDYQDALSHLYPGV